MMTFLGVPIFEWAGLALALGLGVEAWWSLRKPSSPEAERQDEERPE